jgi:DNA-binding NtrC family response regulator
MIIESGNPCDVKEKMSVLIFYSSWPVGARIIHSLARIDTVHITGQFVNTLDQARESEAAIQIIRQRKPGVVIIDTELLDPTWSGVLKLSKRLDVPPIVIMTASSDYSHYRRIRTHLGADYFFELPTDLEELQSTIVKLAERVLSHEAA